MPTLIDSLFLEIGLNTEKLRRGARESEEIVDKTKKQHERAGKEIEHAGERAAEFYRKLRNEALALFAIFVAGKGIKDFVSTVTQASNGLANMERRTGIASDRLYAWGEAARATGGDAKTTMNTMANLTNELVKFARTGDSDVAKTLMTLGVDLSKFRAGTETVDDVLGRLSDRLRSMPARDAVFFLKSIGVDEGTINLMIKDKETLAGLRAEFQRLAPSEEDKRAAADRLHSFVLLDDTITALGESIFTVLTPALVVVMDGLREFLTQNHAFIEEMARGFGEWIKSINWREVRQDIVDIASAIQLVIDKLGGWKLVGEVVLGLWVGSKLAAVLQGIAAISTALTTLSASPAVVALTALGATLLAIRESARIIGEQYEHRGEPIGPEDFMYEQGEAPLWGGRVEKQSYRSAPVGTASGFQPISYRKGAPAAAAEHEAYIRSRAPLYGIDPDQAVRVAKSEGLGYGVGDKGSSFGDWQLHYGGIAPGGNRVAGLGDEFTRETGLDARDPSTWKAQTDWALARAAKQGWGPWHGWRGTPFAGIGAGAGGAQAAAAATFNRGGDHNVSSEVRIQTLNVYSSASDAAGIASDIKDRIEDATIVNHFDYSIA